MHWPSETLSPPEVVQVLDQKFAEICTTYGNPSPPEGSREARGRASHAASPLECEAEPQRHLVPRQSLGTRMKVEPPPRVWGRAKRGGGQPMLTKSTCSQERLTERHGSLWQITDLADEIIRRVEFLIDTCESDIGDFIQIRQMLHHDPADFFCRNFSFKIVIDL